jgi:hypothetical protein
LVRHPRHLGRVILPGDYPRQLKPVYARLAAQFEQRRRIELGDAPVAPLPEPDVEDNCASRAMRYPTLGDGAAALAVAVGFGGVGVSSLDNTTPTTTHPAASVAPADAQAPASGVHIATLTGCVSGLDC